MAKNDRWGKEFKDNRNWKDYQEQLLKRFEIYLDLDWVSSWEMELKDMNQRKRGKPFNYPNSMIKFQSFFVEKFTLRGAESITRKLENFGLIPKCNDHATIHRRMLKMNLEFSIPEGIELHEGTDGSGFKMTNSGEYFQSTYGKERRKYAKVVITATKDDILAVDVVVNEKGKISEPKTAVKHLIEIMRKGGNIVKSYDDGAFDSRNFFNFLEEHGIDSAIRVRANASRKAKGSQRRKREVIEFKELGYRNWADKKGYGNRWTMTEGHFSAIKRGYGDSARAKNTENVIIELKRKVWIYDSVRKYGRNHI